MLIGHSSVSGKLRSLLEAVDHRFIQNEERVDSLDDLVLTDIGDLLLSLEARAPAQDFIPLANICAWVDKNWIDGVIKGIESGSQSSSTWLRKFTTGRASDYLLMAAVGMLIIVGILWGVA